MVSRIISVMKSLIMCIKEKIRLLYEEKKCTYAITLSKISACCRASAMIIGARFLNKNMLDANAAINSEIQDNIFEG